MSQDLDLSLDIPGTDSTQVEKHPAPQVLMEDVYKGNHKENLIVDVPNERSLTTVKAPYNTDMHLSLEEPYQEMGGQTEVKLPYMGGQNGTPFPDGIQEEQTSQTTLKEVVMNGHQSVSGLETQPKRPYPQTEGAAHSNLGQETHPKRTYTTPEEAPSGQRSEWENFADDDDVSLSLGQSSSEYLPSAPPSYSGLPTDIRQDGYSMADGAVGQNSTTEPHTEPKQPVSVSAEAIGRGNGSVLPPTELALPEARSLQGQSYSETTQVKTVHNGDIPEHAGSSNMNRWERFDTESEASGPQAGSFDQSPSLPPYNELPSHLRQEPNHVETSRLEVQTGNESIQQTQRKEPVVSKSSRQYATDTGTNQLAEEDITNARNPPIAVIDLSEQPIVVRITEDVTHSAPPSYRHAEVDHPDEHWVTESGRSDEATATAVAMNIALNEDDDTLGLIDEDYERCGAPKWAIAVTVVLCLAIVTSVIVVLVYFLN